MAIGLFILPLSGAWLTGAWVIMWAAIVLTVVTGARLRRLGVPGRDVRAVAADVRERREPIRQRAGVLHLVTAEVSSRKESAMTALLREVIGDVLRQARIEQGRTLREVSDDARVSLGYLSEVERGRKEASSELLSAICGALDVPLSRVLTDAGEDDGPPRSASPPTRTAASAANIDVTHQGRHPAGRVDGGRLSRRRPRDAEFTAGVWSSPLNR